MRKYEIPDFLVGVLTQSEYEKWLFRKATAHYNRDKKRGNKNISNESYKTAIHKAVISSIGIDAYTGEKLNWKLISKYDNNESETFGRQYKKQFALLPTVDHVDDGLGKPNFKICSWRVNDAKNDLNYDEFVILCQKVIDYSKI
jgi:hypothetical protein